MKAHVTQPINWQQRFSELEQEVTDHRLKHYYSTPLPDESLAIAEVPMVAMDFETTGLDPKSCDIVSIGLVPFTLQRIYCRQAKHWLLNPIKPLAEQSIVIHGITHSEVDDAPDFEKVLPELLAQLAGKIAVVHYRRIEREFLSQKMQQLMAHPFSFPVIDTMDLEARAMDARRGFLGKLLRSPIGSLRLGDARKRYGLPSYTAHNALTDALATAELLQAQIAYHYRQDTALNNLWR